nr:hypothetical protein [Tanacetum cinerariifolium]
MLDKTQYNSWQSRMKIYIKGKEHGKYLFDLVLNGPFTYGTVEVPATPTTAAYIRERTYEDLIEKERIREECNGHMARWCTKPKRPKNSEWFKEKMLLAQALESGAKLTILAIFHNDDRDAFDSGYDEAPSASTVLVRIKKKTRSPRVLISIAKLGVEE